MGMSVEVSCVGVQVDIQCGLEGMHVCVEVACKVRVRMSMTVPPWARIWKSMASVKAKVK
jgi:hypothetical protein